MNKPHDPKHSPSKTALAPSQATAGEPKPLDVFLPAGRSSDGDGVRGLRLRPQRIDAAEIRPLKEGQPILDREVVSLSPRSDAPGAFDVTVDFSPEELHRAPGHDGPAQVANRAYRQNWDRIFLGPKRRASKRIAAAAAVGRPADEDPSSSQGGGLLN